MKTIVRSSLLSTAVLLALSACNALAATANATFTFNITGEITYTPSTGALSGATAILLPADLTINALPLTYLSGPNDFSPSGASPLAPNDHVTLSNYDLDLSFLALPILTFTTEDGGRYTFTANNGQKNSGILGGGSFVNIFYSGQFTDSTGEYDTAPASLSFSFNQTGGRTGAVAGSGTFATPPQSLTAAPEPTTMFLLGSALTGLGIFRRKKNA